MNKRLNKINLDRYHNILKNLNMERNKIITLLNRAYTNLDKTHSQYNTIKQIIISIKNKTENLDPIEYITIATIAELLGKDKLAINIYEILENITNNGIGYVHIGALCDDIYKLARRTQHKPISEEIALKYYLQAANFGNEYGALQMIEWSKWNFSFDYFFQGKTRDKNVDRDLATLSNGYFKYAGDWYFAETITEDNEKLEYYKKLLENGYELARLKIKYLYTHEKETSLPFMKNFDYDNTSELYINEIIEKFNNIIQLEIEQSQSYNNNIATQESKNFQELWKKIQNDIANDHGINPKTNDNYLLIRYGLMCEQVANNCLGNDISFKMAKKTYEQVIKNGFIIEGNVRLAMLHIRNNYIFEGLKYLESFSDDEVSNYLMWSVEKECLHCTSFQEFDNKKLTGEQHYLLQLGSQYQIIHDIRQESDGINELPLAFYHLIESAKANYLPGLEFYYLMHPSEYFMDMGANEILERYHEHMIEDQHCYSFLEKVYYNEFAKQKGIKYMKKRLELIAEKGDIINFQDVIKIMQEREYPEINEKMGDYLNHLIKVLEKKYKQSETPYLLYELGIAHQLSNKQSANELAKKYLLEGAKLGNEKAAIELANLYCSGKLGYRDYTKAIKYYEKFQNNPLSLYMLAQIYYCNKHSLFPDKLSKEKAIRYHERYHTLIHKNYLGI